MYKKLVVLDKRHHKDLKINPLQEYSFAKETPFLPVLANEVLFVGETFPVVFTADETPSIIALVSTDKESLAVQSDGKWIANYIPSHLRKYPFALGNSKESADQKILLIDEESNLFSKSEGKELFNESGEQTDALTNAIDFLTTHENQTKIALNVAKTITDSGILEDRAISTGEGENQKVLVQGFRVVNREKLNALSDDVLADWVRKGIITLIDSHLQSLDNIQALFNLSQEKEG